uniref:Uncharacterized protein n=1 Tax=Noctiluca scintillans TaxID=2966 RepID=A0A7S1FDS5_NOCSC|mmetsp:Transcript_52981/g.141609  ORF Transcript_52981/g.141609 Transcript_52981/m.141609 type:complete len:394 (+) Transcript_52981:55-1236(+)|eukprot:CAMPEP_0194504194 /NCGR_PEP_ID=MMETSP0253-20130528/28811_1 /TAXON_ID=2966 /ORGANISM="Noctiluca scintillans" /LENGTH=393 /DNA_ID=CAMNT_0039346563 /DNA_START=50 /DNA_END=1231 /DNA_ORIENTATION=+
MADTSSLRQELNEAVRAIEATGFSCTNSDQAVSAFSRFHTTVIRIRNSVDGDDIVLDSIDGKARLLNFLVAFAKHKRLHSKRVGEVVGILITRPAWDTEANDEVRALLGSNDKGQESPSAAPQNKHDARMSSDTQSRSLAPVAPAAATGALLRASPAVAPGPAVGVVLADKAVYQSTKKEHLLKDVTDIVNQLLMDFGPEDFTAGRALDEVMGDPAPGDSKKLVVTMGVNVQEFDQTGYIRTTKNFNLRKLVESAGDLFQWHSVKQGDYLPELKTIPIGNGYVGRSKGLESGMIYLVNGKFDRVETHQGGAATSGDVLCVRREAKISWVPISRRDGLPECAVHAGATRSDGDLYVAKKGDEVGKLNLDQGKMWNIWCRSYGSTDTGEVLVIQA